MIGYVTFGTNDLPRRGSSHDAPVSPTGAKRLMEFQRHRLGHRR
jgi:hypothetical protein